MTTPERRQALYSKMLRFMIYYKVNSVPVDITKLCQSANISLIPLSKIIEDTSLSAAEIFALWGNEDGAVHLHNHKYIIAYNDDLPSSRIRFTLCEELAHIVFNHISDPDFNMFTQDYAPEKYLKYDEEARLGAGFLICHPRFFYAYERCLQPEHLSSLCGISLSCAKARREVYMKYKDEITSNITYQFSCIPHSRESVRRVVGL
jgi:Zn-dependent peptidase ImmA (M78 family)